jgi:plastocyanin
MKRIVMVVVITVAACEGEPPKVPVGAAPAAAPEATAATSPPASESSSARPSPAPALAGGGDAAAMAPDATAPNPAAIATKANLSGTVTTTPAAAAGKAVVYLEDAPIEPTAKMSVTVDNRQLTFAPFLVVVPAGGHVVFHNSDPFPHNVFSPDNDKFNKHRTRGAGPIQEAREIHALCNLHPMLGYRRVASSYFWRRPTRRGITRSRTCWWAPTRLLPGP